jgi:hypothetical protein
MSRYDEPKFVSFISLEPAAPLAAIGQVMTASGAVVTSTYTAVNDITVPVNCALAGGVVVLDTAGVGSGYVIQVQSGTTIVASASITNTASASAVFALDTSSTVVSAGGRFNVSVKGTGTASATQNSPALRVILLAQQQFS